ncbi:unnamed protein product [Porites lobata]|uniref:Uncharacterized protein n=1 Tax=Porites lobata TaxID=104759 RepID=A0ABN8MSC4_9CNID|nr:unnamed protein product [Porites lobata]
MPHADIFHLHVKSKKEVFAEKPERLSISDSTLYKLWDSRVKIPTKCQGLRKKCFECGKMLQQ